HMTPVICVCNGTGLAPFRGFLQEREHIQQQHGTIGQLHLFFGCRSRKEDFIYADELLDYEARGLVKLHVAFSRDQGEKVYVQNKMRQEEREHIQQQHGTIGQLHLFFGCRSRKEDFIYAEELFDHEARGLVKLHVAFSRDQEEKVYVQHKMRQEEELIADILMKQNGRFYVCGDARTMAKDVQEELRRMIAKFSGSTAEEAKNKFVEMVQEERVVLDVWG
ncbi:hypothetical protein PROFUN_17068, partial [Planoprotostelium fungivorum]